MVDHGEEQQPCQCKIMLHQGVQRRIVVTVCHETDPDIVWREVKEVVIGKRPFNVNSPPK